MDPGNVNIGNYSQNVLTQPIDASISSLRQFEPLCQFHQTDSFNNEIAFQDLTESLSYTEEPELQHYVCDDAEDTNIQEDSFKEENPMGTSTFTHTDQFALECVRQPSRSPPVIHCSEETLKFMEMPLANSTATESALNPSQSQDFVCEEEVHSDVEQPFYKENNFNLLDLRANYETEEIAGSSKGVQNSMDIPEMSVRHQKEVPEKGRWSPQMVSTWAPTGICWSDGASQEACLIPDAEQSLESLQPLEEDMALNEVLRKLKLANKEQETRIQDLEHRNTYLEKKVEELQMNTTKQHVFVDIINKLKEKVEELIEEKYRIKLEKNDTEKTLQSLHEILVTTQNHLQECRSEKETLQLEFKKLKGNYASLEERYMTQCMEMDSALSKKEEEIERLQQLKGELEKATSAALDLLKRERETREQEVLSLREEFQKRERKHLDERENLKSKLEKLVAQVQKVQFLSDSEKAKNAELQQQIDEDTKMTHSNLFLNHSPCEEGSANPPDMKRTSQPTSRILSLLALMVELLPHQDIINPDAEHFKENEKVSDMPQKLKSFHLKKKILDKEDSQDSAHSHSPSYEVLLLREDSEQNQQRGKAHGAKSRGNQLLKHKDKIAAFRQLLANEKSCQHQVPGVTEFDSKEAKNVRDVPVVLGAKLNQPHNLNEELDFLVIIDFLERVSKASQYGDIDGKLHQTEALPPRNLEKRNRITHEGEFFAGECKLLKAEEIAKLENLLETKEDHCNRLTEENDTYQRHLGNLINKVTSYEEIIKCADQRLVISHSQIAHLEERNKQLEDLIKRSRERVRKPRPRSHPKPLTVMPVILEGNRNDLD
ncbi:cancer-associated gene 1 protein isoform X2 [Bos javanicus]|uniref:cancer-associated gene 1 protein isoform X2 n=1 Tax=Bos javanicus TaxID=9906 RepID=UPI002AA79EC9|nr:cancer-associated gene 1 protein isoform X2 [Bos javanicus]